MEGWRLRSLPPAPHSAKRWTAQNLDIAAQFNTKLVQFVNTTFKSKLAMGGGLKRCTCFRLYVYFCASSFLSISYVFVISWTKFPYSIMQAYCRLWSYNLRIGITFSKGLSSRRSWRRGRGSCIFASVSEVNIYMRLRRWEAPRISTST